MVRAALNHEPKYVRTVAFARTGDPDLGEFGDAESLGSYGDVPAGLSGF